MKWFLWIGLVGVAASSLLAWLRAPDEVWVWKLAIVVGEFGHALVWLPLLLGMVACRTLTGCARGAAVLLSVVAIVGLLRPVVTAWWISRALPADLTEAFGQAAAEPREIVAFSRLYRWPQSGAGRVTTAIFAQRDGQDLKLDFYAPAMTKNPARRPGCIVVIHGGGWDGGDRTQLAAWNAHWAERGYAVASISYRLAPGAIWPAQRDDGLAALAWLKAHADELGFDGNRLVLLGRSAGGQLATALGYGARDPAIRGVIALYAPHDMPFAWSVSREDDALNSIKLFRQYFGGAPDTAERRAAYAAASGQLLARADSPPTLLIHGVPDTLAWERHSARLATRLTELRVPHYYLRLPWATHGFDFNLDGPGGQLADYAIERFLSARLQN